MPTPIPQSICDHYLAEYGALREEPVFLIREELREVHQYNAILRAIADGKQTAKEIAEASGIPNRNLPYYHNKLIELSYISKRYPLTGAKPSPQKVRFVLEDPMLRFWFRFIYPELSYLRQTNPSHGYQTVVAPQLDAYFGYCFERLCQEALALEYSAENVPVRFETGSFWNSRVQIDVVGYRDDDRTDIGECKWGKVDSLPALKRELQQKVDQYPNPRGATLRKMAFTRHPLKNAPEDIVTRSLEDLYSDR